MTVNLKDEKLLDSWGVVIENSAGKQDYLLNLIQWRIEISELPEITWETVEASTGFFKGLLGKKRTYLMVRNKVLKDYRMYVGARTYGRHLDFSWFLTIEPGFFKSMASKILSNVLTNNSNPNALSFNLDLFDQQDLRAYVTSVHRCCVKRAVEQLVAELGQQSSNFDWKSKGFLSIW